MSAVTSQNLHDAIHRYIHGKSARNLTTTERDELLVSDEPPKHLLSMCVRCKGPMMSRTGLCAVCESAAHKLGETIMRADAPIIVCRLGPRMTRLFAFLFTPHKKGSHNDRHGCDRERVVPNQNQITEHARPAGRITECHG